MSPDKAIKWLQAEQFNQWILTRGEEEKVSSYDGEESIEDSISRFAEIIELQSPGKYKLEAYKGKSRQASAKTFRFDVKNETPSVSTSGRGGGSSYNAQDLFDKAKEAALNEFRVEQWKKDVDLKIEGLMQEIADIKLTIKELHDDDDDNDDDALDRISEAATKIPGIANGIKGLSGLFQK